MTITIGNMNYVVLELYNIYITINASHLVTKPNNRIELIYYCTSIIHTIFENIL